MRADGTAVAGARVEDWQATTLAVADAHGCFAVARSPADANLRVTALGYRPSSIDLAATTPLLITLAPATDSLLTIGGVSTGRNSPSTESAPSRAIDVRNAEADGFVTVADVLASSLALTAIHPTGAGANQPASFAVRGPDPTETLVDLDGFELNDGNTGDVDLSLLDPSDLQNIEVAYGIAPSSLVGPNTIGGAIDLHTIEPTTQPHRFLRLSTDSFGAFATTIHATGTGGRVGYALSLHRLTSPGEVRNRPISPDSGVPVDVGDGERSDTALGKMRYRFSDRNDGYIEFSAIDQTLWRDSSAGLSTMLSDGSFAGAPGATIATHAARCTTNVFLPLTSDAAHESSIDFGVFGSRAERSVTGEIADASSGYYYNNIDSQTETRLEFDRDAGSTSFSTALSLRHETLAEPFGVIARGGITDQARRRFYGTLDVVPAPSDPTAPQTAGQTEAAVVGRYAFDAGRHVRATAALYVSKFTTFGSSTDP